MLQTVRIEAATDALQNEVEHLRQSLSKLEIAFASGALPIRLELASLEIPVRSSTYQRQIARQGYRLLVTEKEILIQSPSPAGVFYGAQTFLQGLDEEKRSPRVEILDWPDLAVRMVMVDPARQNENRDYYRRVIAFCARYKINFLHVHLTDNETSCLYHEDYPPLMHPQAWTPENVRDLVAFAKRYHIELIPEIESLGHAKMFARLPDARDYLHQTEMTESKGWAILALPGHTTVLCPASEKAGDYLEKMYDRSNLFPYPQLHIGCDEVGISHCKRCRKKFGEISQEEWFRKHLLHCQQIAAKHGRTTGVWSDMLLKYPEILNGLSRDATVIYDWHYKAEVSPDSVDFFLDKGFEVIACPALVCWPHIIIPSEQNYTNIQRFAEIAREKDLLGIDTTIWIPMRYLSDALWPGIAFASVHSWAGSNWDEDAFYRDFFRDFFGSPAGKDFGKAWKELYQTICLQNEFHTSCWANEEELDQACTMMAEQKTKILDKLKRVQGIRNELLRLDGTIKRHRPEWEALKWAAAIRIYTLEHLIAAPSVRRDGQWNTALIQKMDEACLPILKNIERDWDRNRFADDPNKDGIHQPRQHLLHKMRQMHAFHREILNSTP